MKNRVVADDTVAALRVSHRDAACGHVDALYDGCGRNGRREATPHEVVLDDAVREVGRVLAEEADAGTTGNVVDPATADYVVRRAQPRCAIALDQDAEVRPGCNLKPLNGHKRLHDADCAARRQ